jgi:hypothetical protein
MYKRHENVKMEEITRTRRKKERAKVEKKKQRE